jgi:hypothetical protein
MQCENTQREAMTLTLLAKVATVSELLSYLDDVNHQTL